MQKYKYKDSGIQWLGKIPEHWKTTKIKNEFVVIPSNVDKRIEEDETLVKLCNYVDVYYNDFITNKIEFMEATATDHEINKFILNEGDVLITKDSEDPFDIAVPAVVKETQEKLLCGYHLSMIRSINKKISGEFLFWLLKDHAIASQLHREAVGVTRWAIASRHIKNSIVSFPPIKEQVAIAKYLNSSCQIIDKAINIKKQQIESLEMHKESKLFELLTRGFDKKVKLKPSEINWINTIPENWKRKRVKDIVFLQSGNSITSEDINSYDTYPVYGGNGLRGYTSSYTHEGEFTLIGRQGALCGNVNYAGGKFWASEHAVVATPIKNFNTLWLGELLRVMNLNQYSNAAAQPGLAVEKIKNLCIPFPPIDIQNKIADYLKIYIDKNNKLANKLNEQLDNLKSYRKSIIHECVTGKKQVADIAVEKEIKRALA
jgi:type I restriction enzyme S subunit